MRQDAESDGGARWATADDPRKTRVGAIIRRFSIDELPQLFNVLRGEMSLVGPRPERPIFVDLFRGTLPRYDERHLVRPGITGWSQVHMKRTLETSAVSDKLEYDLQYVENWSPFLDVAVLFQTALRVPLPPGRMRSKLRVLHILPSVRGYGAERLIVELLKHLPSPTLKPRC